MICLYKAIVGDHYAQILPNQFHGPAIAQMRFVHQIKAPGVRGHIQEYYVQIDQKRDQEQLEDLQFVEVLICLN